MHGKKGVEEPLAVKIAEGNLNVDRFETSIRIIDIRHATLFKIFFFFITNISLIRSISYTINTYFFISEIISFSIFLFSILQTLSKLLNVNFRFHYNRS